MGDIIGASKDGVFQIGIKHTFAKVAYSVFHFGTAELHLLSLSHSTFVKLKLSLNFAEITTYERQVTSFYRVSSSAFSFEVKAHSAAVVGLAKEPGNGLYWFGFGQGGKLWIKGPEGIKTTHGGNYSLTLNQFRRFWIAWDSGTLRVGQGREDSHILSLPHNTDGLNYVTFSLHDPIHPATWKFELPPASVINIASNNPHKKIQGGELRWIAAEDALPDDAVIGGFQPECLYIIRAHHAGSLTPGKFVPSEGVAYISWGGTAHVAPEFEVLCGYNYIWEKTFNDKIPANAFVAGFSEVNHEKLYIGRANHMNFVIPGKVQQSHKVCYISYDNSELPCKNYEILTIPDLNPYAARVNIETTLNSNIIRHMIPNEYMFENDNNDDEEENDVSEDD